MSADRPDVLIAGATGYIGGAARASCCATTASRFARSPATARGPSELERDRLPRSSRATCSKAETLPPALDGIRVAYYLVHSMGRGGRRRLRRARQPRAPRTSPTAAADAGVERIVYLGGLGEPGSEHLRSRHETAEILGDRGSR